MFFWTPFQAISGSSYPDGVAMKLGWGCRVKVGRVWNDTMSIRLEASAFQPVPLRTQILKRKSCQRTSCTVYVTALDLRRWRWILWNLGLNDWTGGGGGVALGHMFSWILFDKKARDRKRFDHGSCADIQWHTHELSIKQESPLKGRNWRHDFEAPESL